MQVEKEGVRVVYGMSHEDYLAVPALSSSAIKMIDVSISDFMHGEKKDTKETILGTAIHDAVLLGLDSFYENYTTPYVKEDGVLDTVDDLKAFCDKNGLARKSAWKKDDYIQAVKESGIDAKFYADELAEWTRGKIILSQENYDRVLNIYDDIYSSNIAKDLEKMDKEVSVFWTDKNGIKCKCRFDGLNGDMFDLKSFSNPLKKKLDDLPLSIIRQRKYDLSCVHYTHGYQAAREAGIEGFTKEDPFFHLLFVQTEGGYNYLGYKLRLMSTYCEVNSYWADAENRVNRAKDLYKKYVMEKEKRNVHINFEEVDNHNYRVY